MRLPLPPVRVLPTLALALLAGLGEFAALQAWRLRDRLARGPAQRG